MVTFSNIINEIDENPLSIERANEGNAFTDPAGRDADTLGGELPGYYASKSTTDNIDAFLGIDVNKLAGLYSESSMYGIGAYVVHNGLLYRCISPVTAPEAWNIVRWTASNFVEWSSLRCTNSITKGANINAITLNNVEKCGPQVHINYACSASTAIGTGEIIGTIPVGYRPNTTSSVPCQFINNATTIGYCSFKADGTILLNGSLQASGIVVVDVGYVVAM